MSDKFIWRIFKNDNHTIKAKSKAPLEIFFMRMQRNNVALHAHEKNPCVPRQFFSCNATKNTLKNEVFVAEELQQNRSESILLQCCCNKKEGKIRIFWSFYCFLLLNFYGSLDKQT